MSGTNSKSVQKEYVLLRWIEDDMYGVMPVGDSKDPEKVKVQRVSMFGWKGRGKKRPKFYDALVLKISSEILEFRLVLFGFKTF